MFSLFIDYILIGMTYALLWFAWCYWKNSEYSSLYILFFPVMMLLWPMSLVAVVWMAVNKIRGKQ